MQINTHCCSKKLTNFELKFEKESIHLKAGSVAQRDEHKSIGRIENTFFENLTIPSLESVNSQPVNLDSFIKQSDGNC